MPNDCGNEKKCAISKSCCCLQLRTIADGILKSVLLMFYNSMEKEGLRFVSRTWMEFETLI